MLCSSCNEEIVGVTIVLADEGEPTEPQDGLVIYKGDKDDEPTEYYLLHPICYTKVFDEIVRQQAETTMFVAVATSANVREALALP